MKLLLLSNSTNAGEDYLGWPRQLIHSFLLENNIKTAVFVPYAGVTINNNDYEARVAEVFSPMGCRITSVHRFPDAVQAVTDAECVIVGGGNTFRLVQLMYDKGIMEPVQQKVLAGTPFIGWSAGANVACPSMKTTNDMPIVQPACFDTLNLLPFQINPHYLDAHPEGHGGETREQRIIEFLEVNRKITVVGLREACALHYDDNGIKLIGNRPMRVFRYHTVPVEYEPGSDIDFLLSPTA